MNDLSSVTRTGGMDFTPIFDGKFRQLDKENYCIAWEVSDDYGKIVHREAKYGNAVKMFEWKDESLPSDVPTPIKQKIEKAATEARFALMKALTADMVGAPPRELEPDRTEDGDFIEPIGNQREMWGSLNLICTRDGGPVTNLDNIVRVLEGMPRFHGRIWFDEFSSDIMTDFNSKDGRLWTDADSLALQMQIQRFLGLNRISFETVHSAVTAFAHMNKRNPAKEWLCSIAWDGKPRLGGFFPQYMNAKDDEYSRAISENFFIGMVARVFEPGCKLDNMVVLEGGQGRMKSTALKAIAGRWFTECNEPVSSGQNKDFYAIMRGKMLIEIAELDSFSKADVKRIKAIITTASDRYRPPYAKVPHDFPRTCVFAGTTNEHAYLDDPTGARRFWPIKIGTLNIEKIRSDKDQIFAEAVERYKDGAPWWTVPAEHAAREQEGRRKVDMWEDAIQSFLICKDEITSIQIATECLKMDMEKLDQRTANRIGACLTVLGWESVTRWKDGKTRRVWVKRTGG